MIVSKNNALLCGLLVGGIIGGITTLLATPSSGKELRGQLQINRKKLEETLQQIKDESIALKDQIVITAKESTGILQDVSADLKKTINQFQQEIEPHKKDLQKEFEEVELKIKQLEKTLQ